QLLEPRVVPQRIERRLDPEPPRREPIGNLEQRLEQIERALRLPCGDVDPDQLKLSVGPSERVPRAGIQLEPPKSLADSFGLTAEIGEYQTLERVKLGTIRRLAQALLEGGARRVGIGARAEAIAAECVHLGEHDSPGTPLVVELAGREPEHQLLLL